MIRTTRVCRLGKNYCNLPLFTQRALILRKQIFVEFSVVADKEEQSATQELHKKEPASFWNENRAEGLREFYGEIKYSFLRDLFQGGLLKNPNLLRKSSDLKEFFNKLPAFKPPEIIKILKLLSESNSRPILSIKALCGLLISQQNHKYTVKECADLLYSLAKLSYKDHNVNRAVADHLLQLNHYHSPKTAGFMLYNLADLRFRDCELLDKLLKFVLSSSHSIKTSLHCLRAASLLNYSSSEVDQIIQNLSKLEEVDFVQSTDYVDFIWSCIVLNKHNDIDGRHISNILSENYITRLITSGVHASVKWKLLNINGQATQMLSYKGPLLNGTSSYKIMSLGIPNQRNSFLESVLDVLSHVVPKSGLLKPLVNTGAGFYLDFEYIENVSKTKNAKYSKTGIVLLNFNDICSDGTVAGFPDFKQNLLSSMGYKIVSLRFSEYDHSAPLSQKIELLRKKLDAVATLRQYKNNEKVNYVSCPSVLFTGQPYLGSVNMKGLYTKCPIEFSCSSK